MGKKITAETASSILGITTQAVRKSIKDGRLKAEKFGSNWMIDEDQLSKSPKKTGVEDRIGKKKKSSTKLNALSFFSGAMGLDIGLEKAGVNVMLACEFDKASRETIVANEKSIGLIGDILSYSTSDILKHAGLKKKSEVDLIVGGPPCQAFSTAGKRKGFGDPRGNVFLKYLQVIEEIRPRYAVIENVRGLLSSKLEIETDDASSYNITEQMRHVPGSSLIYIMRRLEHAGYRVKFNLYNSANFGVPQIRERVVIICTRDKEPVPYLKPTHAEKGSGDLLPWQTFEDAVRGLGSNKEHLMFSEKRSRFIAMLKPGQYWKHLPAHLHGEAMGNSLHLGGGKTGFYRRLSWDRPSPTLVTHPAMPATELAHPTELRPLSVEEYKRIQQFPDEWILCGRLVDKYRQIGNAVPVGLGQAIGRAIISHSRGQSVKEMIDFKYSRYVKTSTEEFTSDFFRKIKHIPVQTKLVF